VIVSIRVRNFRRFKDQTFTLREGLNVVEGANNAGKTTILYAIEYALFGRVSGYTSATGLLHPKQKALGVELVFRGRDGHRWRLQRVHALPPRARTSAVGHFTLKRSVEADGEDETYVLSSDFSDREESLALAIYEALGMSRRLFEVALMLRQGEIAQILDGARGLDIVLGVTAAVVAGDEMRSMALEREKEASALPVLEETLRRAETLREGARARVAALEAQRAEMSALRAKWAAELERARSAREDLAPIGRRIAELRASLSSIAVADRTIALHRAELASIAPPADRSNEQRAAEENERALEDTRAMLERRKGDLEARIARRARIEGATVCEVCGQSIDAAHAQRELDGWRAELDAIEREARERSDEAAAARTIAREITASISRASADRARAAELEGRITSLEDDRAQEESAARSTLRELGGHEADIDHAAAALAAQHRAREDAEVARAAVAQAEHQNAEASIVRLTGDLDELGRAAAEAERDLARTRDAVEALTEKKITAARLRTLSDVFRDVQTELRDRAATVLAEQTLAIHRALSGNEEITELRIDPESYAVLVTPADVGREVPASVAQGGGHRLLLGLAFKLAIAKMTGPPPFLLLDEPTYGLDRELRGALLVRLAALGIAPQLVLITHHDLAGGDAHRIALVRKPKESVQA
jgi:exonuclease SbcC